MSHVGRKHGPNADRLIAQSQEWLGLERTAQRQAQIDALPQVVWKGRTLYTIRCRGTSGKGAHDVNVPLAVAWSLIELRMFFCIYHAGDAWGAAGDMANSERVARAVELYKLIHQHNQPTESRQAELARLLTQLSPSEVGQYYQQVGRVRQAQAGLDLQTALKRAAEETEWTEH